MWRLRCGEWESGDFTGRARVPCAKGNNGTPPDLRLCRGLWTSRGSATSRQRSGTQACLMNNGNQTAAIGITPVWSCAQRTSGSSRNHGLWTRSGDGNNDSRSPYIKPQVAGSWIISWSRGVDPSRYQSEKSVNHVNYLQASHNRSSRRKQRRGSLQGARSLRRDVWDWDARNLQLATIPGDLLIPVITKSSHYAWGVDQSLSSGGLRQETVSLGRIVSKPSVPRAKLYFGVARRKPSTSRGYGADPGAISQKERAVDRVRCRVE